MGSNPAHGYLVSPFRKRRIKLTVDPAHPGDMRFNRAAELWAAISIGLDKLRLEDCVCLLVRVGAGFIHLCRSGSHTGVELGLQFIALRGCDLASGRRGRDLRLHLGVGGTAFFGAGHRRCRCLVGSGLGQSIVHFLPELSKELLPFNPSPQRILAFELALMFGLPGFEPATRRFRPP